MNKKLDHLDGLRYAIEIINKIECRYKSMGIDYIIEYKNPFHDMRNEIRKLLGLPLIERYK